MDNMNNKTLKIDLNNESFTELEIEDYVLEQFLGGRGLGIKILSEILPKNIDPLSKFNPLIFSIGPLTGTIVPTSGRFSLVSKSPLTNTIFHSNSGGYWGVFFKKCGYDNLIINGQLKDKSYILIDGHDHIEIKDANSLWGLKTSETVEKLKKLEGNNCQVLCIGPAGENLAIISCIMNQAHRAFGRGGLGAVMGSKNLKAIVVKNGNKSFQVKIKDHLKQLVSNALDKIKVVPITSQGLALFGTAALVKVINQFGMFPANNNQIAYINSKLIDDVSGETLREKFLEKEEGCYNCIIRCGRLTNTGEKSGKGPEYESLWALGPQTGIYDLKAITHANYLCNDLGLDTISTGVSIACAMELQQKGLIKNELLKFGNKEALCKIVDDIAWKKDIGSELADGSFRFSKKYNGEQFAMQVKGMELPAYDPRGAFGHALNYAVSSRGACHLTGFLVAPEVLGVPKKIDRFTVRGKSDLLVLKQNQSAVEDSLVVCKFVGYALGFEFQARFLSAILGKEVSITDLITIGERIYTTERLFNVREGFSRKDDTLPDRFLQTALKDGPSKDRVVPLEDLLGEYYEVRQWDESGVPKDNLLERLSLKKLN